MTHRKTDALIWSAALLTTVALGVFASARACSPTPEPVCGLLAPEEDFLGIGCWTPAEAQQATHPPRATPEEPMPYTPEPEQVR